MLEIYLLDVSDMTEEKFNKIIDGLSERRRARALRYVNKKDGYLSAGAGYLLDCALKMHGLSEKQADLYCGEHGKPYIKDCELFYNLSHGGDIAVCALADGEVGIDVQKIVAPSDALIKKVCSEGESKYLISLNEEERSSAFTWFWTIKESYLKFTGEGLSFPLRGLNVSLTPPVKIARYGETQEVNFANYRVRGYAVSVCRKMDDFPRDINAISI